MDDREAIAICTSKNPTPAAIKKVLAWASGAPSPDKIAPLLTLQTKNYAGRKGFGDELDSVLAACGAADARPLWETIDGDWETQRIWQALRALAAIGNATDAKRMAKLARKPVPPLWWDTIREACKAAKVKVDADVVALQRRASAGDWAALDAPFVARKTEWEARGGMTVAAPDKRAKPKHDRRRVDSASMAVLDSRGETNRLVASWKSSLAKRLSPTGPNGLMQAMFLCWFLAALGREDDAIGLARHIVALVPPTPSMNVWTHVGYVHCLLARLYRTRGDARQARVVLETIVQHSFHAAFDARRAARELRRAEREIARARHETSQKWACIKLAAALAELSFLDEMSRKGLPFAGQADNAELGAAIDRGLADLRARLTTR